MSDRLIVHAHVPKSGAAQLNRNVFLRIFTRGETMLAYGDGHAECARLPRYDRRKTVARVERARFALGHVPYGYFDGFDRWTIYVSVFDDPVRRFLNFAGAVMTRRRDMAQSPFGAEARTVDPERMIEGLLETLDLQLRQSNMMTRIAAGLAAFAPVRPRRSDLSVACANVARSNYLVTTRDQLPGFERHLEEVIGVPGGPRGADGGSATMPAFRRTPAVEIARGDLSARLLLRIEAVNELDMRLYDAVASQQAACAG